MHLHARHHRFNIILILSTILHAQQVFLLAHCKDNGLYLRTLATGTELHCLKGHKSKVKTRPNPNRTARHTNRLDMRYEIQYRAQ